MSSPGSVLAQVCGELMAEVGRSAREATTARDLEGVIPATATDGTLDRPEALA